MAEYDVIEVNGWTEFDLFDDFGGTLENVIFDQTANDSVARLSAQGSGDWTIRNVAWKGEADIDNDSQQVKVAVTNSSGTGLIENVYMGDGCIESSMNGILADFDHAGTLTVRHLYIEGYADNGAYLSDPGDNSGSDQGDDGVVQIEECYGLNNNITQLRIGSPGSYIKDSVMHVTSSNDVTPLYGSVNARGARAEWQEDLLIENCDIKTPYRGVQATRGCTVTVRDTRINGDPDFATRDGSTIIKENVTENATDAELNLEVPDGVPTSAEEAAEGDTGGTASDRVVIEYNHVYRCRKEIYADETIGYVARHNYFDFDDYDTSTDSLLQQDVDDRGADGYHEVYNNTFVETQHEAVNWRDDVDSRSTIHHNWFYHDSESDALASNVFESISTSNVHDNHYGTSTPPSGVGADTTDAFTPGVAGVFDWGSSLEGNDEATQNTVTNIITVDGVTGDGSHDEYDINGDVTNFSYTSGESDSTLRWDGYEVTTSDFPLAVGEAPYTVADSPTLGGDPTGTVFEVIAGDSVEFSIEFTVPVAGNDVYRWTVEGSDPLISSVDESNVGGYIDTKTDEYVIEGFTGNGFGDAWDVVGTITDISIPAPSGDYTLRWDGEEVTESDLPLTPEQVVANAVDDSYSTNEDVPLDVSSPGVLSNDAGDGISVTAVTSDPTDGTVSVGSTGGFSYEPDSGFTGTDTFTYEITDDYDNSDTAVVSIDVGVLDPTDDSYTTPQNETLEIGEPGVLSNDSGHNPQVDGVATDVTDGTLTLNADGSFTYEPDTDFAGEDSFVYDVSDDHGDSGQATVTIGVDETTDPPDPGDYTMHVSGDTDSYTVDYDFTITTE